jgi:hypothetical protein
MYELFAKAANEVQTYLCRRVQNRIVQGENDELDFLDEFIEKLPVADTLDISVPRDSHTNRKARTAKLEIKFGKVIVNRPTKLPKADNLPEFLEVYVISAKEVDPPEDGTESISWQLITNVKVETIADAVLCISWYPKRWKIEIFHYTLKSGCAIEKLQEREAGKLEKLITLYSVIALRIMRVTFLARSDPDASCEIEFSPDEWKILYMAVNKVKKKNCRKNRLR